MLRDTDPGASARRGFLFQPGGGYGGLRPAPKALLSSPPAPALHGASRGAHRPASQDSVESDLTPPWRCCFRARARTRSGPSARTCRGTPGRWTCCSTTAFRSCRPPLFFRRDQPPPPVRHEAATASSKMMPPTAGHASKKEKGVGPAWVRLWRQPVAEGAPLRLSVSPSRLPVVCRSAC